MATSSPEWALAECTMYSTEEPSQQECSYAAAAAGAAAAAAAAADADAAAAGATAADRGVEGSKATEEPNLAGC